MDDVASLKREAKRLRKAYDSGDRQTRQHVHEWVSGKGALKHADFLHDIARQRGFRSWPALKVAVEADGLDYAAAQERFRAALYFGQKAWIERLLERWPEIGRANFGLSCATYDVSGVKAALAADPGLATRDIGSRRPLLHLCLSQWGSLGFGAQEDALEVARALVATGADVNDSFDYDFFGEVSPLPALYGAISHARNISLARWLLENGANPNDNESLYHATEQRDRQGLALLLEFGAKAYGTNALLRAMDFDDHVAVKMMLDAGADPNEPWSDGTGPVEGGVRPLHQCARRRNGAGMARIVLDAGADPAPTYDGLTPYELARVAGNGAVASVLEERCGAVPLAGQIALLARIADGARRPEEYIDTAKLPGELRNFLHYLLANGAPMAHLRGLVEAGMDWDHPDEMGLTPVQLAGWHGAPEVMGYFLSLKPDLGHVNGYGGTLLSTIIHGSENAPLDEGQDHVACLELALREGVALPKPAIAHAGREDVLLFLEDWAERYPGQVVEHGIA